MDHFISEDGTVTIEQPIVSVEEATINHFMVSLKLRPEWSNALLGVKKCDSYARWKLCFLSWWRKAKMDPEPMTGRGLPIVRGGGVRAAGSN